MPAVKLNSAQISRVLSDQVAGRILVDYVSDSPGKRKVLGRSFDAALDKEANYLAKQVVPDLEKTVKKHYSESFDLVTSILNDGIMRGAVLALGIESPSQLPTDFHKFTRAYYLQKVRNHPETSQLFWKYTGRLYRAMRKFANNRKAAVGWSNTGLVLKSRHRQRHGMRYRFQIDIHLPAIKNSDFMDNIFRKSYLTGSNSNRHGLLNAKSSPSSVSVNHDDPLSYLQFNEASGPTRKDGAPKTRPFITELMLKRGLQVQGILLRRIRELS